MNDCRWCWRLGAAAWRRSSVRPLRPRASVSSTWLTRSTWTAAAPRWATLRRQPSSTPTWRLASAPSATSTWPTISWPKCPIRCDSFPDSLASSCPATRSPLCHHCPLSTWTPNSHASACPWTTSPASLPALFKVYLQFYTLPLLADEYKGDAMQATAMATRRGCICTTTDWLDSNRESFNRSCSRWRPSPVSRILLSTLATVGYVII